MRVGIIGVGGRGRGLLGILLTMDGVEVRGFCDINQQNFATAQGMVERRRTRQRRVFQGRVRFPAARGRDDLDAVLIATPWHWHTPMAVAAMKAHKYVGIKVPAAITLEQCWELVHASEEDRRAVHDVENWSFRRDNLAVLNMIRQGLLGEIVHYHCAHSHNCVDHWFFRSAGQHALGRRVSGQAQRQPDPTHSLGPVLSWMDINCGDAFAYLTSTATQEPASPCNCRRNSRRDHPNVKRKYAQGDIVTTGGQDALRRHRSSSTTTCNCSAPTTTAG